jgi:UDP-N-acetylmuramate--alanine ligase
MIQKSNLASGAASTAWTEPARRAAGRVHLVGIGGTGLAGLARMYLDMGLHVSGSDVAATLALDELRGLGVTIYAGHDEAHVDSGVDRLVLSAAIPETNPECACARRLGIPVEKYADALARMVNDRQGIAVAGTHGKTTVTAWIAHLLRCAGRDAGYLVGGQPLDLESSGHVGADPAIVIEACEYDRTFLRYRPVAAVINNIEEDHLDYYSGIEEIRGAFREFVACIRPGGVLAAPVEVIEELALGADRPVRILSTGLSDRADVAAEDLVLKNGTFAFTLRIGEVRIGAVHLGVPGMHNVRNAVSVAAIGHALDIEAEAILAALRGFRGVMRRIHRVGAYRGAPILDDYAHHPTEVAATLRAVRDANPGRRIWAVFQPHQYSRTRRFLDSFCRSFEAADRVLVTEIFRAREEIDPTLSGLQLAEGIRGCGGCADFVADLDSVIRFLRDNLEPDDLVITMGAGDVTRVAHELVR